VTPLLIGPLLLGLVGQPIVATSSYGAFPMALDALWNPNTRAYSALLPASALNPSQALEGMNYLGAGLLALTLIALAYGIRHRADPAKDDVLARLVWLLPAFTILTLVAIWPHLIWRGREIAALPMPPAMPRLLDPVRAAGRLFWPVDYAIALAAIAIVCRMRHATLVLAAALLLQIIDLAPLLAFARGSTVSAAVSSPYRRTRDPRWDALIAHATMIEFEPPEPYSDLALLEEITWRAVVAGKPVRYFYASREPLAVKRRLDQDRLAFHHGTIDPHRLYVLLDGNAPPALAAQVTRLDGVAIIAPRDILPK